MSDQPRAEHVVCDECGEPFGLDDVVAGDAEHTWHLRCEPPRAEGEPVADERIMGIDVPWTADDEAALESAFTPKDEDHVRLVNQLRYIATSCSHTPSLTEGDHIHEPTTGGEQFCGPCQAWRVLNGSPDAWT